MKTSALLGAFIASLLGVESIVAAVDGPVMTDSLGIKSATRNVKGNAVTVFVQERGKKVIVLIAVAINEIKYADIAVIGVNQEGKEIEAVPVVPNPVSYGAINGGPVGVYKLLLKDEERLAAVSVSRADDSQIFDVTIAKKKN